MIDRVNFFVQSENMDPLQTTLSAVSRCLILTWFLWSPVLEAKTAQNLAPSTSSTPTALVAASTKGPMVEAVLPESVKQRLKAADIAPSSLSVVVQEVPKERTKEGQWIQEPPRLMHLAQQTRTPASLMKLVTTQAALDLLGPQYTWKTAVYTTGAIQASGTLMGDVIIRGGLDPKLTIEGATHLLQKLKGLGVQKIQGDVIIDKTLLEPSTRDPAQFDGEPLKAYNVVADALLINFNAILMTLTPDPLSAVAHVMVEPPLEGLVYTKLVPLSNSSCADYKKELNADLTKPLQITLQGSFSKACGQRVWPMAFARPREFTQRALAGIWRGLGAEITGEFKLGALPQQATLLWSENSLPLSDVIKDMNKYSNNVMAQHLFLTLSLDSASGASENASREMIQRWWHERVSATPMSIEQGSGLSREDRISAQGLAELLSYAWLSPFMPEVLASLPITGLDGTLKRRPGAGLGHLKTGSLRDVNAVAGYVQGSDQRRYILVAVINDPKAREGQGVLDSLIQWVANR